MRPGFRSHQRSLQETAGFQLPQNFPGNASYSIENQKRIC